jgi:hypothetical protein
MKRNEEFVFFQHQNAHVRHRFLQRILNKVAQWKLSVSFLGFTIAVPNDDEDLTTGKNLKSVMERLYLLASKGSGKNENFGHSILSISYSYLIFLSYFFS